MGFAAISALFSASGLSKLAWKLLPYAIALMVGAGLVMGIFQAGVNYANRKNDVLRLQTQIATERADKEKALSAAADADQRASALEVAKSVNEGKVQALEHELATRKDVCALSEPDARSLRDLSMDGNRGQQSAPSRFAFPAFLGHLGKRKGTYGR